MDRSGCYPRTSVRPAWELFVLNMRRPACLPGPHTTGEAAAEAMGCVHCLTAMGVGW